MEHVLRSDIFFFITSIAVIIFSIVLVIAGFYLIKTMKNFSDISATLKKAVDEANADLNNVKEYAKNIPLFGSLFNKTKSKKAKHTTKS